MSALYFTRAVLSRRASAAALIGILSPDDEHQRASAAHKLLWTLFADGPDRKRDFLWRQDGQGAFYLLSHRPPIDRHDLFELAPPKPFAPDLAPGDSLQFSLRANATVSRLVDGERKRCDIVMDRLNKIPQADRAGRRSDIEREAAAEWMADQGSKHGFEVLSAACAAYEVLRPPHRGRDMRIGVLDIEGALRVTEPDPFLARLAQGFGRARAYGCGLMLIKRLRA